MPSLQSLSLGICFLVSTPLLAVEITSVEPSLVSTGGGQVVTFIGTGFTAPDLPYIDGVPLTGKVLVDARHLRGVTPVLAPGFHEAQIARAGVALVIIARLPSALVAAPPSTFKGINPAVACSEGGTMVAIVGTNFRAETKVMIGSHELVDPVVARTGKLITGEAPELDPGEFVGAYDVTVGDSRGSSTLSNALTYKSCPLSRPPGPQEIEASLAEGIARFHWSNPIPYKKIQLLDEGGALIQELRGDETSLDIPAGVASKVGVHLQGVTTKDKPSRITAGLATKHQCLRPPSLVGRKSGDFGFTALSIEFPLYGGHVAANVSRCIAAPLVGGGGELEEQGGGGSLNGFLQDSGTIGYVVPNYALATISDTNKVTTGFILDNDSDRLEIGVFYQKIATDSNLELRGRLTHVYPADGFSDEFTFPDVRLNQWYATNTIIYYRADKDVGHLGNPNDPDPTKRPPKACNVPIPAGEYLLDVYAVGGSSKLPYYKVLDAPEVAELLIAGAPCPPYPAVSVRDMTGLQTLPDILEVKAVAHPLIKCSPGGFQVTFSAYGTWFDEQNGMHAVPPNGPADENNDFEYAWSIYDQGGVAHYTDSYGSSEVTTCVCDWGCYKLDLTITDRACGFSIKRSFEVPVVPRKTTCPSPYYTFEFPQPEPGGIYAVVGLQPPPGEGSFEGQRPVEFRILVVPKCYCDGDLDLSSCPAASLHVQDNPADDDIEFRLERGGNKLEGAQIEVVDLCPDTEKGAKYFHVAIKDLGEIPTQNFLESFKFKNVHIQGRTKKYDGNVVVNDDWQTIGNSLKLANYPPILDGGQHQGVVWSGNFDEDAATYHFIVKSSPTTTTESKLGDTPAVDILGVAEIPAYPGNHVSSGFVSRFKTQHGSWFADDGDGVMDGMVLGNRTQGKPLRVKGSESHLSGLGNGGGASEDFPTYEWCDHEIIFQNHFSQTLFESILFAGSIGPVPITIWASIGLGLDFMVESQLAAFAAPFAPVDGAINGATGQHFAETHFYLCSSVAISVPCDVRADILGGLANLSVGLVPTAGMDLKTDIGIIDSTPESQFFVKATFGLSMEIQACINLLLFDLCTPTIAIPIVDPPTTLLQKGNDFTVLKCSSQADEPVCEGIQPGQGGGVILFPPVYQSTIDPVLLFSPDDMRVIAATIKSDGQAFVGIGFDAFDYYTNVYDATNGGPPILDPAGAWVSNENAIVAWTRVFPEESGVHLPLPQDLSQPNEYLPPRNKAAAQTEIVISPANPLFGSPIRIADEITVPLSDRRADGRASIAGDLPAQEAIVAWVRYESPDFLIVDPAQPTKTIRVPCPKNQVCFCPTPNGCYTDQTYVNYRPNMEETAIYARRVNFSGGIGDKKKLSTAGINIEPSIAISPSGNVAYCVWIHDPTHTDLINSNTGRFLKYSVYSKPPEDSWSPPKDVVKKPNDYPGLLEPFMALKGDGTGLAAFTAIEKGSSARDTGLGAGSRFVYVCHLENGVFGDPIRIHGKCLKPENGHWVKPMYDVPEAIDPLSHLHIRLPDWVIIYQGQGPMGLRSGSGDVMVSVLGHGMSEFTPPRSLTLDDNIHSNVSGSLSHGRLHTINLNRGPAKLSAGGGGAGGGANEPVFETKDTALAPDPAVVACKLSDPFSAPGSSVMAHVDVENLGLAGTPYTAGGQSAVELRAVFISEDGTERVAATPQTVQEIAPGDKKTIDIQLEMPLDPVRLRVELNQSPLDSDLTNNWSECFFGAPRPKDFACEAELLPDEDQRLVALLSWTSAAVYDQLIIYRDGASLVSLPGTSNEFVDLYVAPGLHTYAIRGRILASKSSRAECIIDVKPPSTTGRLFVRADANSDGRVDISDAVFTLNYLFLGNSIPLCEVAADSNDDGKVNISDPSFTLNFLFLGGTAPPSPSPIPAPPACGPDPTPDALTCGTPPACR